MPDHGGDGAVTRLRGGAKQGLLLHFTAMGVCTRLPHLNLWLNTPLKMTLLKLRRSSTRAWQRSRLRRRPLITCWLTDCTTHRQQGGGRHRVF